MMKKCICFWLMLAITILPTLIVKCDFPLSEVANMLRFEYFTKEPSFAVTADLYLHSDLPDGILVRFISDDESVLRIDGEIGKIMRPEACDVDVTLTAVIWQAGTDSTVSKIFAMTVLAKNTVVHIADSFVFPDNIGDPITSIPEAGWQMSYPPRPNGIESVISKYDGTYALKTYRNGADNLDYAYCQKTFDESCKSKLRLGGKMMFDHIGNQNYLLQIHGTYDVNGSLVSSVLIEMHFVYDGNNGSVTMIYNNNEQWRTITLMEAAPTPGEWFDIEINADVYTQEWFVSIDGECLTSSPLPFYEKYRPDVERGKCTEMTRFGINPMRFDGGGNVYIDEIAAVSIGGMTANATLYDLTRKINGLEERWQNSIEARLLLSNISVAGSETIIVYACVYEDGKLYDIKSQAVTLNSNHSQIPVSFSEIKVPANKKQTKLRFYFWDNDIKPLSAKIEYGDSLSELLTPREVMDAETGRIYYAMNLYGGSVYRSYFTQQIWAADNERFYFYTVEPAYFEVYNFYVKYYEYNVRTKEVKYIDKGFFHNALMVTPQNNLYYINAENEIIKMDLDSYERLKVGSLPPWQKRNVSLLQVNNAETKISLEWMDESGEFDARMKGRIPILDLTTGQWDLRWTFGFEKPWYYPNHICINPIHENLVLSVHEGEAHKTDRIWVLNTDVGSYYNAMLQKKGEWISHESWTYDGQNIIFVKHPHAGMPGYGGVSQVKYDGTGRKHINDDYKYQHCAASPDGRFAVADTVAANGFSKIVLIDCFSGKSTVVATVPQDESNSRAHCHPMFTGDGRGVIFGIYDGGGRAEIGWADVSDIIANAPSGGWVDLSDSCAALNYEGTENNFETVLVSNNVFHRIPEGKTMRIDVKSETAYAESADAKITISYLDSGFGSIQISYFVYDKSDGEADFYKVNQQIACDNTGSIKTKSITIKNMSLDNMEKLGADFKIIGKGGEPLIKSISIELSE